MASVIPPYYITIASLEKEMGSVSLQNAVLINQVSTDPIVTSYTTFKQIFYSNDSFNIPVSLRNANAELREEIDGIGGRIKLPMKGIFGKLINFVRDLLP